MAIQNKEYEELGKIVRALDDMITNIGIVIDEAPTIVMMSKMILPKKNVRILRNLLLQVTQ